MPDPGFRAPDEVHASCLAKQVLLRSNGCVIHLGEFSEISLEELPAQVDGVLETLDDTVARKIVARRFGSPIEPARELYERLFERVDVESRHRNPHAPMRL